MSLVRLVAKAPWRLSQMLRLCAFLALALCHSCHQTQNGNSFTSAWRNRPGLTLVGGKSLGNGSTTPEYRTYVQEVLCSKWNLSSHMSILRLPYGGLSLDGVVPLTSHWQHVQPYSQVGRSRYVLDKGKGLSSSGSSSGRHLHRLFARRLLLR